jgi:ketosteroid isomerase-like protein
MQSFQDLRALAAVERDLIEERATTFVKCRVTADVKTMVGLMAVGAVYTIPGDRHHAPCFGRHTGLDAIRHFLSHCHVEYQTWDLEIFDTIVDTDRVVVRSRSQLRHRGTGASRPVETCDVLKFENGFITDVQSYVDTLAYTLTRSNGI